uniref:Methyltransferase-like protein 5 n=1 Tax=Lynceus sp. MCZ IZ 141354 TaxID=1930659 RepID=A0A9N6WW30_9CRUS|nr:EOG090X0BVL [Lynceus sp. MCZ IZ 141354]
MNKDHTRKVLEEIQAQKKNLLRQTILVENTLEAAITNTVAAAVLNPTQRQALTQANTTSYGYFIATDSAFGNTILPELEQYLQRVQGFDKPKVVLEQYETRPHIASCMLFTIASNGDIEEKSVMDLGCGCGMLTIGSSLLSADVVYALDIDSDALNIAQSNVYEFEMTNVDFVNVDVTSLTWHGGVDTVVMNPPFGTKTKGVDVLFIEKALEMTQENCGVVYSLHKTSTRKYITTRFQNRPLKCQVVAELRYDLPATYKFHKKQSVDIEVDLWRFQHI